MEQKPQTKDGKRKEQNVPGDSDWAEAEGTTQM